MEMKGYNLTCGEVIDNLLMLADAYEKASAGKAPNGFAYRLNPTDAAANLKAAVHFIGSFGQQLPRWITVEERLPEDGSGGVLGFRRSDIAAGEHSYGMAWNHGGKLAWNEPMTPTHWMPLPEPPEVK